MKFNSIKLSPLFTKHKEAVRIAYDAMLQGTPVLSVSNFVDYFEFNDHPKEADLVKRALSDPNTTKSLLQFNAIVSEPNYEKDQLLMIKPRFNETYHGIAKATEAERSYVSIREICHTPLMVINNELLSLPKKVNMLISLYSEVSGQKYSHYRNYLVCDITTNEVYVVPEVYLCPFKNRK